MRVQRGLSTDPAPRVELKIRVVPHGLPTPSRNSIGDEMEAKEELVGGETGRRREREKDQTRHEVSANRTTPRTSRNLSVKDVGRGACLPVNVHFGIFKVVTGIEISRSAADSSLLFPSLARPRIRLSFSYQCPDPGGDRVCTCVPLCVHATERKCPRGFDRVAESSVKTFHAVRNTWSTRSCPKHADSSECPSVTNEFLC